MFGINLGSKNTPSRRINRDPNNQLDMEGVSLEGHTGVRSSKMSLSFKSGNSSQRSAVAKSSLNYQRMSRLGSGEAANRLQKESFSKLKQVSSGSISSGQATRNLGLFK